MLVNFNTTPKYNNYQIQPQHSNHRIGNTNLAPLNKDTVSFSGAIDKDLMRLSEDKIIKACEKALKDGIKIGDGQEAIVYKMEDFPQYCIRKEKKAIDKTLKLDKNLSKYDKVNHVVAKLNDKTTIMRYIAGIPLKIMPHRDTASGIELKKTAQALVANNFTETPFRKVLEQIEDAMSKGIVFDRKGENLHVDPLNQEMTCIDFSPKFHDIEYNPISYVYSALGVESSEYAPKIFGKLCKAYAQRVVDTPCSKLNLKDLDLNFYHRGFMDDPFNEFPNRDLLDETQNLLENLIQEKQNSANPKDYIQYLADEFKNFIDEKIIPLKKQDFSTLNEWF